MHCTAYEAGDARCSHVEGILKATKLLRDSER